MNLLVLTLGYTHEFICSWQGAFNFSSPISFKPLFRAWPHSHLLPTPHHHTTKGLLIAGIFIWYIKSDSQEKLTRYTKRPKAQFEETKQASEPESDMAGVLELPDQEF